MAEGGFPDRCAKEMQFRLNIVADALLLHTLWNRCIAGDGDGR